jgi:D-alanyl-D-alanine carboxypeptidase/D-alanyl-D-alanine-endopeptidase (penicillin-binding protein 4)
MPRRAAAILTLVLTIAGCAPLRQSAGAPAAGAATPAASTLAADLDALFTKPPFDTALWSVRIERLRDGHVLYERNPRSLVMPASNMKIVTMAAAAETLGWDHRFETRLVADGEVRDGTLHGDLIVIGGGDPSISAQDFAAPALFREWAEVLLKAGITRVTGRLIGDDNAFDDATLGAGWAWDYLPYGYAAPVSALQYNEGVAVLRVRPGAHEGDPATVLASPPGHGLEIRSTIRTGAAGSNASIDQARLPGQRVLQLSGSVPLGGPQAIRTTSVDNPTLYFVTALRGALADAGVRVEGDAVDVDDLDGYATPSSPRLIASHGSAPLSELGAYFMKVSQNMYGETFLKAMGRTARRGPGSLATGRAVVRGVLEKWDIAPGTYALFDGSGLSRYNEISAHLVTTILRRMYEDERHRGWFLAALPVGGHDGTLDERMKGTELQRAVQAKTGTISNARALSGFLTAPSGERFIFSMIANNFLRPSSEVDAIAEGALKRVLQEAASAAPPAPAPRRH